MDRNIMRWGILLSCFILYLVLMLASRTPLRIYSEEDLRNGNHPPASLSYEVNKSPAISSSKPANTCTEPQNHVVFIKTHKTASTSLQLILQMYGYHQNLSFIFNEKDPSNGHLRSQHLDLTSQRFFLPPISIKKGDYKNYKNYDMSTLHMNYNKKVFSFFVNKNAKYITIAREPVQQFKSAFVFFGYAENIPGETTELKISKWLENPRKHDKYLNNNMMFDLGLHPSDFHNSEKVDRHIEKISREFDLILIADYFDESLLLLRKLMCWRYEDILYLRQNTRSSRSTLSDDIQEKIRRWNSADVRFYDFFNRTLWHKIAEYGPEFDASLF